MIIAEGMKEAVKKVQQDEKELVEAIKPDVMPERHADGTIKKGSAPNKGRRHSASAEMKYKLLKHMDEVMRIHMEMIRNPDTKDATRGSMVKEFYDRTFGKPLQQHEIIEPTDPKEMSRNQLAEAVVLVAAMKEDDEVKEESNEG